MPAVRVLMLSWRGPGHPAAGGAEVLTHEVLRRWVAAGHEVTWFSGAWPGCPPDGPVDGVHVVRRGGQATVHVRAWRWLRSRQGDFDRVVDQINTIPFFTPFYVPPAKRRFLIHQLAREYWWRETRGAFRLIAPIGYVLEPLYLRAYRRSRGATISSSTRADLERIGIAHERIDVVNMGLDVHPVAAPADRAGPLTVVMLGRLTPAKFVEEGVRAFAAIRRLTPDARLSVIGTGDPRYRVRLQVLARRLGIEDAVTFHGRVPHDDREALLTAAHVHLFCSHREGWGLVVSEAGAAGTPTVAYDAPGVRDSVAEPELLAPIGDIEGLARRVVDLCGDAERYRAAQERAWRRASSLSYELTAHQLEESLVG